MAKTASPRQIVQRCHLSSGPSENQNQIGLCPFGLPGISIPIGPALSSPEFLRI